MARWQPRAADAFLNPALMASLLTAGAAAHEREARGRLMVWPLGFLIPPLVLHRPTRQVMPRSTSTHLSTWVADHPTLIAALPLRVKSLLPAMREGFRLGIRTGMIQLEHGRVRGTINSARNRNLELDELLKAAHFMGRWMAKADQPSTVFALLGVRP